MPLACATWILTRSRIGISCQEIDMIRRLALLSLVGAGILCAYTPAQSNTGRLIYSSNCASCHMRDLIGRNEAPPLTGANFIRTWGTRSTTELLEYIRTSMPPGNVGGLPPETCAGLVAFILEANGAAPGNELLTSASNLRIGSLAGGKMPSALRESLSRTATDEAGLSQTLVRPKGLSVRGEVKDWSAVTDQIGRAH